MHDESVTTPTGLAGRYEATVRRSGDLLAAQLDELAKCQRALSSLVQVRSSRVWTDSEHEAYLRLRRSRTQLQQRALKTQRAFDFARNAVRDRN